MTVDSLTWTELRDFSGGLWIRKSERECPQNGLLEATDCYPQPSGGLAAFMRFEPVSHTGLVANSIILGVWWLRPPFPQGRLRLAALEIGAAGIHTFRIYSMQVSSLSEIGTGTWNADHTTSNVTVIDPSIQMTPYRDSTVGYRNWFNLPASLTTSGVATTVYDHTTQGIYRLGSSISSSTVSSGTTQRIQTTNVDPALTANTALWFGGLVGHQARLLFTGTFDQLHNRIYMTSQGSQSGSTDFIDPLGEKSGSVTWMAPSQSDYLVAAKSQIGTLVLQGDMRNAVTRQTSFSHNYLQSFPAVTDLGVAFMSLDDACYIATQGGNQNITPNFYGTPMDPGFYPDVFNIANSDNQKLGQPTVAGDFLFMGKGYVMDLRTNAWFKSSYIPDSKNFTTDTAFFRVFCSDNSLYTGSNQVLRHAYFLENSDASTNTWNPAPSYTFTSPLISNPHQRTQVREIEYHIDAFKSGSTIKVEVFVPNQTEAKFSRTYEVKFTGPGKVRCSGIHADGEWVKVRTTIASNPAHGAPNEAPMLERVLLGTVAETRTERANRQGE